MEIVHFEFNYGNCSPIKHKTFSCHLCSTVYTKFTDIEKHYLRDHNNVVVIIQDRQNKTTVTKQRYIGPRSRMPDYWLEIVKEQEARTAEAIQSEIQDYFVSRKDAFVDLPVNTTEPDPEPLEPWPTFSELLGDGYFDVGSNFDDVFPMAEVDSYFSPIAIEKASIDEEPLVAISPFALNCHPESQNQPPTPVSGKNLEAEPIPAALEEIGPAPMDVGEDAEIEINWDDLQSFLSEACDQSEALNLNDTAVESVQCLVTSEKQIATATNELESDSTPAIAVEPETQTNAIPAVTVTVEPEADLIPTITVEAEPISIPAIPLEPEQILIPVISITADSENGMVPVLTAESETDDLGSCLAQYIQANLISPDKGSPSSASPSLDLSALFRDNFELRFYAADDDAAVPTEGQSGATNYQSESEAPETGLNLEICPAKDDPHDPNKENVSTDPQVEFVEHPATAKVSTRRKRAVKRKWSSTSFEENSLPATKLKKEDRQATNASGTETPGSQAIRLEQHGIHTTPRYGRHSTGSGSSPVQQIRRRSLRFMEKAQRLLPGGKF